MSVDTRVSVFDAGYEDGVRCVVMPCCGFTFDASHTDDADNARYSCPQCDPERQLQQARSLACEYASRFAEIERLLRQWAEDGKGVLAALDVVQGAAVQIPLRVLNEWALRGRGWTQEPCTDSDGWRDPKVDRFGGLDAFHAVAIEIEREEAAPAAEARDA